MAYRFNLRSEYVRNTLTLASGTTIAQAIPIAITPVLSRVYSPAEFGLFAIYMALISIGTMVATGRYEVAVLIARKDSEALQLAIVSGLIAGAISFMALVVFLFLGPQLAALIGQPALDVWLYVVPFSIFLLSTYKALVHWLNRKKSYPLMSQSRIIQSGSISVVQLVVGLTTKLTAGLALADCLGRFVSLLIILRRVKQNLQMPRLSRVRQYALLRRYRKFPLLGSPASLLNMLSLQLPYLLLPVLFSSAVAGLYFMVARVLMMPIGLLGEAVMQVFRKRAIEDLRAQGSCRPLFVKTFLCLLLVGAPPTLLLLLFGQPLFALVLGEPWREAGLYAAIMAPAALLRLAVAPLSGVLFIREKLTLALLLQAFFVVMVILSLVLGWLYRDPALLVSFLSVSGCLFYLAQGLSAFRLSAIERPHTTRPPA